MDDFVGPSYGQERPVEDLYLRNFNLYICNPFVHCCAEAVKNETRIETLVVGLRSVTAHVVPPERRRT